VVADGERSDPAQKETGLTLLCSHHRIPSHVKRQLSSARTLGDERVLSTSMHDGHRRYEASESGEYVKPAAERSTAMVELTPTEQCRGHGQT
jgi:hypothetical protein